MAEHIFRTENDYTVAVMRLVLGVVFFAHGAQKALGWFGGPGFDGTIGMFSKMGIGEPLAVLAIAAEFLGGLGLIAGLLARIAALGVMINMLVAILLVHLRVGFFMNWAGNQGGEGFEFHLLAIALAIGILVKGAGALSIDRVVAASFARHHGVTAESRRAAQLRESGAH
jgi:putative oxidoreductase